MTTGNGTGAPKTVDAYLAQLKRAMKGCPPAMIRDALSDAEEHLRNELAQDPDKSEAEVLASVIDNYGTPEEIAEEYRAMERTLAGPFARPEDDHSEEKPRRRYGFFGVVGDPRAYGALIYMLLALATGIFYSVWTLVWGLVSISTLIFIFGFIIALLFIGSVRLLSLVEGRIVEGLLGVRMPRRLPAEAPSDNIFVKVKNALLDYRTWSSIFYFLLMLPLGIIYFVVALVFLLVSLTLTGGGLYALTSGEPVVTISQDVWADPDFIRKVHDNPWIPDLIAFANSVGGHITLIAVGILLIFITLHVAKGIGYVHGRIAETLLVRI